MIPASSSITFIIMGMFFGLTAGISPGPLLTLVISETLKHNRMAGIKVAVAPLVTDLPIILITYLIFSKLSQFNIILSLISFLGGIFFSYLGYETLCSKMQDPEITLHRSKSLKKGIIANFLNPHPYIFWLTAGIPTAFKAYETNLITAVLYFLLFYALLIGSKIGVVFLVEKSKSFLRNKTYRLTMQIMGIILLMFALFFFYDSIKIWRALPLF